MSLEFDEKGKYFTDIITKSPVAAIIQTSMHRIEGFVHVRLGGRLKDELDLNESFLAVTNAKVLSDDGTVLYEAEFMSVSRGQIIWIIPSGEKTNPGDKV